MEPDPVLTLVTPHGVYGISTRADASTTITTNLTALQYAARHLTHEQWSEVLRAERAVRGERVITLPADVGRLR